jgi:hypothetical protein
VTTPLRRARELLTGRHHVRLHLVPTISGRWAWSSTCDTCTGLSRTGLANTREQALAAAHRLVGDRDDHHLDTDKRLSSRDIAGQLLAADERALHRWDDLHSIRLPATTTGTGYTVATGCSYGQDTGTAAWALITDAGWCVTGLATTPSAEAAELRAVRRALDLYPTATQLALQVSNDSVADLIEDLLELTRVSHRMPTMPTPSSWATPKATSEATQLLRARRVTVHRARSTTHPLHRLATTLAQAVRGSAAHNLDWTPADVQVVNTGCTPACTS